MSAFQVGRRVSTISQALCRASLSQERHLPGSIRIISRHLSSDSNPCMRYRSSRGAMNGLNFEDAVLTGLGTDRGLLVPEAIPTFAEGELESWRGHSFQEIAFEIMSKYISTDEIPSADLKKIIDKSYSTFRHPDVTPVHSISDQLHVLELFHGPTFAFKDVALQFLGNTFEYILSKRPGQSLNIIGATSGDTGSASIYGVRGKDKINCFMTFPEGRVSHIQELQMTTVMDSNIHNISLEGTFDDCQEIVKTLFQDLEFKSEYSLGAVNSINWARILAQMTYYVSAYLKVTSTPGQKVTFSVPTGNFGDILAGWYAGQMGLPVERFLVATNDNDILHRFFSRGEYHREAIQHTIAPAMDICISSNFERFLFHMVDNDADVLRGMMDEFESTGKLPADADLLHRVRTQMSSATVNRAQVLATIKHHFSQNAYTLCPHSAVGVHTAVDHLAEGGDTAVISLACAHWAKFPDAVVDAIGEGGMATLQTPPELAALHGLPTRKKILANDPASIKGFIHESLQL